MIRILLVGRTSQQIGAAIADFENVEVDHAALPAAAVRQMETSPPDLICIVEPAPSSRTDLLVQGIRVRPLGQLTPIIVVAPPAPIEIKALETSVDRWLGMEVKPSEIVAHAFELLGLPQAAGDPQREIAIGPASDDVPYYIEEIVELAPRPAQSAQISSADADGIRRKLRAVRHEDYFVILEVGRGAETSSIREAFFRLSRVFDIKAAPFEIASEFEPELLEIADAIEDAWAVLGDADLRRTYIDQTSRR